MARFSQYFLTGLILSITIMMSSVVLAETNLNTAYIQPRTLVYSGGNLRTYADNKFDGFQ